MNTRQGKLFWLALETAGIAALFLPFDFGVSPRSVLLDSIGLGHSGNGEFWPLAFPAFLALFVWLQTLRSLSPRPLAMAERQFCAVLEVLLALIPLGFWVWQARDDAAWAAMPFVLGLLAVGFLVLLVRKDVASEFLAPISLRCAYLPNAVYCLLVFSGLGSHLKSLQAGAACVAGTVLVYLAEIVFLTRQGLRSRAGTASSARSTPCLESSTEVPCRRMRRRPSRAQ